MKQIKLVGILAGVLLVFVMLQPILSVTAGSIRGPRSPPIPGDLDLDGDVDLSDLAQLLAHYGMTSGAVWEDGDVQPYPEGDGDVDLADLAELLAHYGETQ